MRAFSRAIRAKGAFGDRVDLWEERDRPLYKPWRLMVTGWVGGTTSRGAIAVSLTDTGLRRLRDACDAALNGGSVK